ncbi:hypothetical protein TPENAI_10267 [Tenacibaculum litopenaei]|jgi:uncharacterized membrane-anchored protein YhcB (DUF1043 family)|uniref:hypothetical protein n=1 Tax=Tenacibaculum litopenaei TaxID=396016 RepID=UPI0038930A9D
MLYDFLQKNWQAIANMIGAIFIFLLGRKSRRIKGKEAEFLAYEKKLENYKLEFDIKSEMLENLKRDYDNRASYLEKNLNKVVENNKELSAIIKEQHSIIDSHKKLIAKYIQKFGTIETI